MKNCLKYFKKEKIDWLDEQPYIGKYFTHKIKRCIMNVVYNILGLLEDTLLEKYFSEIKFWNEDKTFEATLPFIVVARNHDDAKDVLSQIITEMINRYGFKVYHAITEQQLLTKEEYKKKEFALQDNLRGMDNTKIGTITFDTVIGATLEPDDLRPRTLKRFERKLQYPIIKNGKIKPLYQLDSFLVIDIIIKEESDPNISNKKGL